jgi:hypothetical protein
VATGFLRRTHGRIPETHRTGSASPRLHVDADSASFGVSNSGLIYSPRNRVTSDLRKLTD